MRPARAELKPKIRKHLRQPKLKKKHSGQTIKADGYVDNSPLRSELTAKARPLLPAQREEGKEKG